MIETPGPSYNRLPCLPTTVSHIPPSQPSLTRPFDLAFTIVMKKFGFGKKGDGDDDSNRSALFGRSSKNSSPASAASNPYAQPPPASDPYAQDTNKYANMPSPAYGPSGPSPYQQARQNYGAGGGPGPGRPAGLPGGPAPNRDGSSPVPSRSPQPTGSGYGAERYGSGAGYGSNRYESKDSPAPSSSRYGPGGYGGLGRRNSNETVSTEDNREALFGDAKQRYVQKASLPPSHGRPGGGYGESAASDNDHSTYGEGRQLTAEEEEEEDVQATKQQIRFMKQEDVASTRNALRIAAQAEETGRATLARLGAQGERIHNTEKNLDLAANHSRIAEERARELRTLNKSMFAVHVSNPFTASSRRAERDQEIIEKHRAEREQREATRAAAFGSQQRMEQAFRDVRPSEHAQKTKASLAERSKYQFEADSEDEEMENEIDSNLDALSGAASRLHTLAQATGKEVDAQNGIIDVITRKVCVYPMGFVVLALMLLSDRACRRPSCNEQSYVGPYSLSIPVQAGCGHRLGVFARNNGLGRDVLFPVNSYIIVQAILSSCTTVKLLQNDVSYHARE